jgi:hypothetical protein
MDNLNTVGDFLRSAFSTMVNKNGKVFKALVANPEKTGTVEQIFNGIEEARDEWCNNSDFYNQYGEMLEKTLSFFSLLERLFGESDDSIKCRNELLFYRSGDTIWGDYWNILKIFKQYFRTEYVYIVNNTNPIQENLLLDGDFEKQDGSWELDGCSYEAEARFSEQTGIKFQDQGTCQQAVNANQNAEYFLHFFLQGKIAVNIKDNNGRYWDSNAGELGGWVTGEKLNIFTAATWNTKSIYFLTDETVSSVNICFTGLHGEYAYLDYIRLFLKKNYSTFTLIAIFGGIYTDETMSMAPGTDDPVVHHLYNDAFGHYSAGKDDGDPIDNNNLSFIESAGLIEGKEPVMAGKTDDVGESEPTNNMYLDEQTPLAPWDDDNEGITVDYSKMSYIEQSHLFGVEGAVERSKDIYTELLNMVRAGGIASYIEILTRELD